jgi:hypothetical protein
MPARQRRESSDLPPPARAEFLRARASAFQAAEASERRGMGIFSRPFVAHGCATGKRAATRALPKIRDKTDLPLRERDCAPYG